MKIAFLVLSFVAGFLFQGGHLYSFAIRYLIMCMLFFSFLEINLDRQFVERTVFLVLIATIIIAFFSFYLCGFIDDQLALAAFMTGITPTATAAPVITSFLRGKVEYVAFSVLITNGFLSILIPLILPFLVASDIEIATSKILTQVCFVVFFPLVGSQVVAKFFPYLKSSLLKIKKISFFLWIIVLYLAVSQASFFISNEGFVSKMLIFKVGISSCLLCFVNFFVGRVIGGDRFAQEASQSLGQKNTMFTIWISITYINPIVALGPTFYVLFHNMYNSYQLYLFDRKK